MRYLLGFAVAFAPACTGSLALVWDDRVTALGLLSRERVEHLLISNGRDTVRASLGRVTPCREDDPGSGCSTVLYPLPARGVLTVHSGRQLEIEIGASAHAVFPWLGRYTRRPTNCPRGNCRGTLRDRGDFSMLRQRGEAGGQGRRWRFAVPKSIPRSARMNVGVIYANADLESANWEAKICVAPCSSSEEVR